MAVFGLLSIASFYESVSSHLSRSEPLAPQQVDEVRRADDGCRDADGHLAWNDEHAAGDIADQHEIGPEERGQRKQPLMTASDEQPRDMRSDQADEADRTDGGDGAARQGYGEEQQQETLLRNVQAERGADFVAELKDIQLAVIQPSDRK